MTVAAPSTRDLAAAASTVEGRPIVVDIGDSALAASVQSVLAVAGIASSLGDHEPREGDRVLRVISAREPDTVLRARKAAERGEQVVVMHVPDAGLVARLVKAGAADVVMSASSDADLAKRIQKLQRRRR